MQWFAARPAAMACRTHTASESALKHLVHHAQPAVSTDALPPRLEPTEAVGEPALIPRGSGTGYLCFGKFQAVP